MNKIIAPLVFVTVLLTGCHREQAQVELNVEEILTYPTELLHKNARDALIASLVKNYSDIRYANYTMEINVMEDKGFQVIRFSDKSAQIKVWRKNIASFGHIIYEERTLGKYTVFFVKPKNINF